MEDRFLARVWDKQSRMMFYSFQGIFGGEAFVWMQCTGQPDKLGSPIYEGDIVKHVSYRVPLYNDPWSKTNSQYDVKVEVYSVVVWDKHCLQWRLDSDNPRARKICELKGNETTERRLYHSRELCNYNPSESQIRSRPKWDKWFVEVVGDIYRNAELLE